MGARTDPTTVAATLGIHPVVVSKMESQTNLYVSTLRRLVEAKGGERRIVARFPQGAIEINPFQRKPEPVKPEPTEPAAAQSTTGGLVPERLEAH